jgi:hypothetical protein
MRQRGQICRDRLFPSLRKEEKDLHSACMFGSSLGIGRDPGLFWAKIPIPGSRIFFPNPESRFRDNLEEKNRSLILITFNGRMTLDEAVEGI